METLIHTFGKRKQFSHAQSSSKTLLVFKPHCKELNVAPASTIQVVVILSSLAGQRAHIFDFQGCHKRYAHL